MKKNTILIVIAIALGALALVTASRRKAVHITVTHPVHPHIHED